MDYLKYFQNQKYELGKYDCWTFIQDVYKNERGIILHDVPVFNDTNEGYLKSNIRHVQQSKPVRGSLVFVRTKEYNHVGYAISECEYMHKTSKTGVVISRIPKNAEFFQILS